jgi:hypothetical protein
MKPLHVLVLSAFLPIAAAAQSAEALASSDALAAPATEGEAPAESVAEPAYGPLAAADVPLQDQMFLTRPVVVFADSPNDPNYLRQLELLARDYPALQERDVIVVVDTDPEARGEWRQKLRPRGFSLVLMDKDLRPTIRKPLPWDVREIAAAIDKFPLRRQEMLERNPSGR